MKKTLDPATRGIFVHSNYLQSPVKNKVIQEKLTHEDYKKRLTTDEEARIHDSMVSWITQCRKEWQRYGNKNIVKLRKSVHCELCGHRLRSKKYHVINKYTQEVLWVGSECYEHIINSIEGTLGLNYTPEEAKYFDDFKRNNSGIVEFMNNHPTEMAQFIIPNFIVNAENIVVQKIDIYVKRHVIRGSYDKDEYRNIYTGMDRVYKEVNDFVNKANSVDNLSRDWARKIQELQNDGNSIVNRVTQNGGIIDGKIAKGIRIKPFLVQYIRNAGIKWSDLFLSVTDTGEITITVEFLERTFNLAVTSKAIIDRLGYPMNLKQISNSWDLLNILTYTENPVINDPQTKTNLQLVARYSLKKSNYSEYKINMKDFSEYISKQERDSMDKTRVSRQQFENLSSRFVFYQVNGLLIRLTSSELQRIGIQVLESKKLSIAEKQLSKSTLYSKEAVFENLYQKLQIETILE